MFSTLPDAVIAFHPATHRTDLWPQSVATSSLASVELEAHEITEVTGSRLWWYCSSIILSIVLKIGLRQVVSPELVAPGDA